MRPFGINHEPLERITYASIDAYLRHAHRGTASNALERAGAAPLVGGTRPIRRPSSAEGRNSLVPSTTDATAVCSPIDCLKEFFPIGNTNKPHRAKHTHTRPPAEGPLTQLQSECDVTAVTFYHPQESRQGFGWAHFLLLPGVEL